MLLVYSSEETSVMTSTAIRPEMRLPLSVTWYSASTVRPPAPTFVAFTTWTKARKSSQWKQSADLNRKAIINVSRRLELKSTKKNALFVTVKKRALKTTGNAALYIVTDFFTHHKFSRNASFHAEQVFTQRKFSRRANFQAVLINTVCNQSSMFRFFAAHFHRHS